MRAATGELGHLLDEAKVEVAEIYHENLEDTIGQMTFVIPALFQRPGVGSKDSAADSVEEIQVRSLDKDYEVCRQFILDAPEHGQWETFRESDATVKAKFGDVQKRIILANDAGLNQIYTDLCQAGMDSEEFWSRWRFWVIKRPEVIGNKPTPSSTPRSDETTVLDEEWEDWD